MRRCVYFRDLLPRQLNFNIIQLELARRSVIPGRAMRQSIVVAILFASIAGEAVGAYASTGRPQTDIDNGREQPGGRQIYWEYGLATATAGISPDGRQTLVEKFFIDAVGPHSVDVEVKSFIVDCAKIGLASAAGAAKSTPSPEPSARLAAGWAAFKASFWSCLSPNRLAKQYFSKFEIAIVSRQEWLPGIVLKFDAENTSARNYALFYKKLGDVLPNGVAKDLTNKMFEISNYEANATEVHINLSAGDPIGAGQHWADQLSTDKANAAFEKGLQQAKDAGKHLIEQVIPQNAAAIAIAQNYAVALYNPLNSAGTIVSDANTVVHSAQDCLAHPNSGCVTSLPIPAASPVSNPGQAVDDCVAHPDPRKCAGDLLPPNPIPGFHL